MGVLTKGHVITCSDRNRRGGIKAIYLGEVANVTSATIGTAANTHTFTSIGGFVTTGGAYMFKFEFDRETAYYTANATRENGSTVVETELGFTIPKITSEVNARLENLKDSCGLFAIVETYATDATDVTYKFVLGYDNIFSPDAFLEFGSGEQNSGTALQDPNETVVKLTGVMAEYPREYDASGNGVEIETTGDQSYILS
jgi:hypothetical protein|tara:strand:- start:1221 stop:1820 length:600 start_codon:yes stop_codon:yes gene_type:complete